MEKASKRRKHSLPQHAETVACTPSDQRCLPLPDGVESAQQTCTSRGRWRLGGTRRVIVANSGRDRWDVWLDGHTGEGRLRRQSP